MSTDEKEMGYSSAVADDVFYGGNWGAHNEEDAVDMKRLGKKQQFKVCLMSAQTRYTQS
jgi:hypothetical protein